MKSIKILKNEQNTASNGEKEKLFLHRSETFFDLLLVSFYLFCCFAEENHFRK